MGLFQAWPCRAPVGGVTAALSVLAAGALQAQDFTPQVQVEHAAARLVVLAEPRSDISVTVQQGSSPLPQLSVRREGGRIIVDGGLERDGRSSIQCRGGISFDGLFGRQTGRVRDTRAVEVQGVGRVRYADLPVVTAHVPLDARIATGGAVWGEAAAPRSLDLAASGCGDWTVGSMSGGLDADMLGSGDVKAGDAGSVHARLTGSGDLTVGRVLGGMDLALNGSGDVGAGPVIGPLKMALAGSGDVGVASVDGPVSARIASSGDIRIRSGRAPVVQVSVAGSGDFDFRGDAGRLAAAVVGSGDVHVSRVDGPVSKSVVGSGEVSVGP